MSSEDYSYEARLRMLQAAKLKEAGESAGFLAPWTTTNGASCYHRRAAGS